MRTKLFLVLFVSLVCWIAGPIVAKATTFPYSTRTRSYSGWSPSTQSDTNTTGMAGATVALPSSISAAEVNPAGFAMETGSLSAQINRISIVDKRVQPDGQSIDSSQWGLGLSPPPWGFSIDYYSPITESAFYYTPTLTLEKTEVSLKELHFTAARAFFDSHLAIGVSAVLVKAVRELGPYSYNSDALSFQLGTLYHIHDHFILGASYTPPLTVAPASNGPSQTEIVGFNQPLLRPSEVDFGIGWVPNRFFKAGASLSRIGDTSNTALLSDQTVITGADVNWIPRAGASYVLAQFSNFSSEIAAGSYFASSRLQGQAGRFHVTTGWEMNPYFVNLGLGFDLSKDYRNVMIGVGIDIVRTLRTFNIIPKDPTPPLEGFFPNPKIVSADGLPDALTHGEVKSTHPPTLEDVQKIVMDVPGNLKNRLEGKKTTVDVAVAKEKLKKKKGRRMKHTVLVPPTRVEAKPTPKKSPVPLGNGGGLNAAP